MKKLLTDEEIKQGHENFKSCNEQPLRIINIDKALAHSIFEKEVWNRVIEAAAQEIEDYEYGACSGKQCAEEIRSLKK